jgi:mono/diheme cytochrome c family protein
MSSWLKRYALLLTLLATAVSLGCEQDLSQKSDAELGLTPQQASGRRIYEAQCQQCHSAYTSSGRNGPSLKGMYRKRYLPSGIPANDERVSEIILRGKSKMPGFAGTIDENQLQGLLNYLKTL